MKKLISCLLICAAFTGMYVPVNAENTVWKEYYVSVDGSDTGAGTKDAPFKTIEAAKAAVRMVNKDMHGDIVVNIESGNYFLDEMLDFGVLDSGYNGYRVIYRGIGENKPVISGGKRISGFVKSEHEGIYVADYDDDVVLQLSVNGKRRYVAKAANLIKGVQKPARYDTEEWYEAHPNDFDRDKYNYHNPETEYRYDGFYISKKDFGFFENPEDILFMWDRCWVTNVVRVNRIEQDPDRDDVLRVIMQEGIWDGMRRNDEVNSNNTWPRPDREFTVMNAFELLDEPGEFYYNRKLKKLYYMPFEDEDMEKVQVIVPKLETIIAIDGNDVDDKVKNITFDNLQISDSQWDYENGYSGQQATNINGNDLGTIAPRAIFVERADGIEFINNIICNIGGSALDYYNAVSNSRIVGNAIYDIGESAILSGARNHADLALGSKTAPEITPDSDGISNPVPAEYADAPVDLLSMPTTKIHYSYYGTSDGWNSATAVNYPGFPGSSWSDETAEGYYMNNVTWQDGSYKYDNNAWKDHVSKLSGRRPYVIFEFLRPYSIENVVVSFAPSVIGDSEKADFEILASNNMRFDEGTYKTVAVQKGTPADIVNHYPLGDGEKYKYVMIRKLSPDNMALSRVWVETKDRKPFVKNQRCKGIVIENNIAERVGVDASRSIGMIVSHGEDFKIKHNEFRDIGYSGTSVGYAWHLTEKSCFNMDVGYNYVYDTCQTMHDGGGMYTLGAQPGSHYYNNHIERVNLGINGYYTDNGTRYETIENNYVESAMYILSPYANSDAIGIKDNIFRNNFGTHIVSNDAGKDGNNYEDAKHTVIGQPQREAYDTYTNAGLEPEYEHIREYIPEGRDNLYARYDYYSVVSNNERQFWKGIAHDNIAAELKYTLDNANFGAGLGKYPAEYREKLSDIYDYVTSGENPDEYVRAMKGKEFQEELKSVLNRYSYEETLKMCRELLADAKGEGRKDYSPDAVSAFEKALAKTESKEVLTPEDEYDALINLETAYNNLKSEKYSDLVTRAIVPGAISTDINEEKNEITIYVPKGYNMTVEELLIETEGSSYVAGVIPYKVDLKKGINIPVYHKGTGKYRVWRVTACEIEFSEAAVIDKNSEWIQNTSEKGFVRNTKDFVSLSGSRMPYIYEKNGHAGENKITFAPVSKNESKSFNILLGANMSDEFDYGNAMSEHNHIQICFTDNKAELYKVIGGEKKLIATEDSDIRWNDRNALSYKIDNINDNSHIVVKINEKIVFSEVIRKCSFERFIGFYNPDAVIWVY